MTSSAIRCKSVGGGLIAKYKLRVPIGELEIECCSKGVHSLHIKRANQFPDLSNPKWDKPDLVGQEKSSESTATYGPINECVDYFRLYFALHDDSTTTNELMKKTPRICWRGICVENSFSEKVMRALLERIAPGQRISYTELAVVSENPKAQRAVGTVMRKNPIALIVPCHRVIRSNQTIGNYNGGADIKEWLLDYEKLYFSTET